MRALLLVLLWPSVAAAEVVVPPSGWFVVDGDDGGKALPREKAIFHEAYLAMRKAHVYAGEVTDIEDPFYEYALIRQSLVREARFVHASGSGDGGHRDMSPRILVELDGAVWHVEARSKNLDEDGYRRRLTAVKACPLAFLRARALAFEGNPDLDKLAAEERLQCRQLLPLARAGDDSEF